jgi:hypothetical protein
MKITYRETFPDRGEKGISVKVKDQYGVRVIHPLCERAKLFARLAGTKTLTHHALATIEALGYTIHVEQPVIETLFQA